MATGGAYLLSVADLSSRVSQAKRSLTDGSLSEGFMAYIGCVIKACQELIQARGLVGYSKSSSSQSERLCADVSNVADLARYCLDQASSIIRSEIGGGSSFLPSSLATPSIPSVLVTSGGASSLQQQQQQQRMLMRRESPSVKDMQSLLNQLPCVPAASKSSYSSLPIVPSLNTPSSTTTTTTTTAASLSPPPTTTTNQPSAMQQGTVNTAPNSRLIPSLQRTGSFVSLSTPSLPQTTPSTITSPTAATNQTTPSQSTVNNLDDLELVPGIQLEPHHMELLKMLEHDEIVKLGEPVREMQVTNTFLMKKHQAAMHKLETSSTNSRQRVSEMNLSIMRQQTENVAIARAKQNRMIQDALFKVQQVLLHAHQHQQQQQQQQPPMKEEEGFKPGVKLKQVKSILMTKFKEINDKHPSTTIIAQNDVDQVMADGGDIAAIQSNLRRIFATPSHPLAKKLADYTSGFNVTSEHRNDLSLHVGKAKSFIAALTLQATEHLRLNPNGAGYRVAYEIATDCVVARLHKPLWGLMLIHNSSKDDHTNKQMTQFSAAMHPAFLHIKQNLWGGPDIAAAEAAYKPAIDILRTIPLLHGPLEKLRAVVEALMKTNQLADAITMAADENSRVGADELFPVFSYVLIKSGLRNAHSESAMMEAFLCEWMSPEEEGYTLATFLTCLDYVDSLSPEDIASDSLSQALPPISSS